MQSYLTENQAIALAKKALMDIGHWEDFKMGKAHFFNDNDPLFDFDHWIVSFNFLRNNWINGEITPVLIIRDDAGQVINVSWKKSVFVLSYDKEADKYHHPTLSREQRKF